MEYYCTLSVYYVLFFICNSIPYSMFLLSGLPVQRIISELKKITNHVEEKPVSFLYIFLFGSFNVRNCRDLSSWHIIEIKGKGNV